MECQRNAIILSAVVHLDTVDTRGGSLVTLLAVVEARQEQQDDAIIFLASKGDVMEETNEEKERAQ